MESLRNYFIKYYFINFLVFRFYFLLLNCVLILFLLKYVDGDIILMPNLTVWQPQSLVSGHVHMLGLQQGSRGFRTLLPHDRGRGTFQGQLGGLAEDGGTDQQLPIHI